MPANGLFKNFTREGNGGSGDSRQRSILIAVLIAIIAFVLIFVYVRSTHNSNKSSAQVPTTTTVLVAKANIPVATSYATIRAQNLLIPETVKTSLAQPGAVTSFAQLSGSVVKTAIVKGQQATAEDFVVTGQGGISGLTGADRAITLTMDAEHGQTALLQANDRVDVLDYTVPTGKSRGQTQLIATNLLILQNAGGEVTLQVTQGQAMLLAAAQGSGSLWLLIRGAASTSPVHVGSVWTAPSGS